MDQYLGDMGILFAAALVMFYVMWDSLFHE